MTISETTRETSIAAETAHKTIRVLIVDDHETMLWGLEKLIDGQKPRMEVAGKAKNGADAVAAARNLAPDVILLDLDLAGASGLDYLSDLLSNGVSRALILTGAREQAMLDAAVLRGARGVLRKDAPAEQVIKAVEKTYLGEIWLDREALGRVFGGLMAPAGSQKSDPEMEKLASLTSRERKIIQCVVESNGALNKTLAQKLFISEHTLRNHLTSIYQKLGVSNRLELYVYAVKHDLGKEA